MEKFVPKLTVVMAVLNCDRYLQTAIDSILRQGFEQFEFIIINDGSTDGTREILDQISDSRVIVIHQNNAGLAASLNRAISLANSNIIVRQDADDIALPGRLRRLYEEFEKSPHIGLIGSTGKIIDEKGKEVGDYKVPLSDRAIRARCIFENPFIHSSVAFRLDLFKRTSGYSSNESEQPEDYHLWTRLIPLTQTQNLSQRLVAYRRHSASISSNNKFEHMYSISETYIAKNYRAIWRSNLIQCLGIYRTKTVESSVEDLLNSIWSFCIFTLVTRRIDFLLLRFLLGIVKRSLLRL